MALGHNVPAKPKAVWRRNPALVLFVWVMVAVVLVGFFAWLLSRAPHETGPYPPRIRETPVLPPGPQK